MTSSPVLQTLPYAQPRVMKFKIPGQRGDDGEASAEFRNGVAQVARDRDVVEGLAAQTADDRSVTRQARIEAVGARDSSVAAARASTDASTASTEQATISTTQAAISRAQAILAGGFKVDADNAAKRAELAAALAEILGKLFKTVSEGEAATPVDEFFNVKSVAEADAIDIRLRTATGSTLEKTVPSSQRVKDLETEIARLTQLIEDAMKEEELFAYEVLGASASKTSKVIIFSDTGLRKINIQNVAPLPSGGATPTLIGITDGSKELTKIEDAKWILPPLGVLSLGPNEFIKGRFSVISNVDVARLSVAFASRTATDPNINGDREDSLAALLARYSGTVSASRKDSIAAFYRELWRADFIQRARAGGGLFFPQAPNLADSLLDWAGGASAVAFGDIIHAPWGKWTFDGADDYIETNRQIASSTDYTLWGINDGSAKINTNFIVGTLRTRINPSVGSRSRFITTSFSTGPSSTETWYNAEHTQNLLGGIHFITRANAGQYTASFGKGVNDLITSPVNLTGTATVKIGCAAGGTNQPVGFYPGDVLGAGILKAATPGQRGVFVDAYAAFLASLAAGS